MQARVTLTTTHNNNTIPNNRINEKLNPNCAAGLPCPTRNTCATATTSNAIPTRYTVSERRPNAVAITVNGAAIQNAVNPHRATGDVVTAKHPAGYTSPTQPNTAATARKPTIPAVTLNHLGNRGATATRKINPTNTVWANNRMLPTAASSQRDVAPTVAAGIATNV
jgi:hypothetical protein